MDTGRQSPDWTRWTKAATPTLSGSLSGAQGWARLLDVYDGDTLTVAFEALSGHVMQLRVRLVGINTPEMRQSTPSTETRASAHRSRARLLQLVGMDGVQRQTLDEIVRIATKAWVVSALSSVPHLVYLRCRGLDKYGRVLAEVAREPDGPHVGATLLQEGLAVAYDGGGGRGG